jgi:hypothetical protein
MDIEDQIPPPLPLLAAQALAQRAKGRNYPSLAKRGEGRFSEQYVFSIMDSLVNRFEIEIQGFLPIEKVNLSTPRPEGRSLPSTRAQAEGLEEHLPGNLETS